MYPRLETELKEAWSLLQPDFRVSGGRKIRPSRDAATGLLARLYLYQQRWADAEAEASKLIDDGAFALEPLANTFTRDSRETIWQLERLSSKLEIAEMMDAFNFVPNTGFR